MDFFEVINKRRTIRKFSSKPIEFEKIIDIVTCGLKAPSSGNLQNWKFIIVTNKEDIRSLYHYTLEQEVFFSAQVAIIVCANEEIVESYFGLRGKRLYSIQNCAAATENILLAATNLGLGSCWVGAFDEDFVKDKFKIPPNYRPQTIILLGYPAEKPNEKLIKGLVDTVYFNKFGNRLRKEWTSTGDYSIGVEEKIRETKNNIIETKEKILNKIKTKNKIEKNKKKKNQINKDIINEFANKWNNFLKKLKK